MRYVDPSGHSYAVLPNGKRMSINSASDVKQFNSARDRLSVKIPMTSSSQVKTITAPTSEATPITGGLANPISSTTYTTIQTEEQFYAKQKKSNNVFSKIYEGLNWFDKHITTPFIDGTVKFGKAVYRSSSLEIGYGFGVGLEASSWS